jgi:hypothetical protein
MATKPLVTSSKKKLSAKTGSKKIAGEGPWTIVSGELKRGPGRKGKVEPLFKAVGEKIPFEFLVQVKNELEKEGVPVEGVYIAHDSMGYPRYIGHGNIFKRLDARRKQQTLELKYFSYFVVETKMHEREIETIMIRAAGPLLDFNDRKVRIDIQAGDVRDFEPGTKYVERQYKKGKKSVTK